MAKGKEFETIIKIAGKVEGSLKKSLNDVTDALEQMQDRVKKAASATERLSTTIDEQAADLDAAKKKYMDYVLSGEKSSKAAKDLKKKIQQLSSELHDNRESMLNAEKAADKLTKGLDDLGNEARESESSLGVMTVALGNLAAKGVEAVIGKCIEGAQAIYGLAESTREYREDISKLETAFETAGHATEAGTKTYKTLFSVFGEEDRAVEAAQQIAKLADNEAEMAKMTDIATGAWAMWGDSLATESLMEAMNSTAKIGQVQGTLADALEWCGVNLEDYNKALEGMNSEDERSIFILETLDGLYSKAADNYRENNASIIAAREAQSDYNDTLAAMGEKMEPVTTAVQKGLTKILTKILEIMEKTDFDAIIEKIDELSDKAVNFADTGLEKLKSTFEWFKENGPIIGAAIAGIGTALGGLALVGVIQNIQTIVTSFKTWAASTKLVTAAQWLLNAAMSANPISLIIIGVAALVAAFVVLWNKCEGFRNFFIKMWEGVKNAASTAWAFIIQKASELGAAISEAWSNIKTAAANAWNSILSTLSTIWSNLKSKAAEMVENVRQKIADGWGKLKDIMTAPFQSVINLIDSIGGKISGLVEKVKNFGSNIGSKLSGALPRFAKGGFTDGISIAGEAGTEAIISFDRRYREENLGYWAQAGRLLGADFSDFSGFTLSGSSSGDYYDMGGINFAPNIVVHGHADKESIMEAIEAEYDEFMDMLDEYFNGRRATVYG